MKEEEKWVSPLQIIAQYIYETETNGFYWNIQVRFRCAKSYQIDLQKLNLKIALCRIALQLYPLPACNKAIQ